VNPPARLRTSTATEWVAASSTTGGTSAAPAASATVPAGACGTAWATLPVTDIAVATISHAQKNRAALRLPAPKPPSGSSPEVIGMVLQEALRVTVASYGHAQPQRLSAIDSLVLRRPAVVQ
jgi:hypothetical protein